jgi:shikimate 5-dehydrogenase
MIKNDIALAIEKKSEFNRAKSLLIVESILDSLKTALAGAEILINATSVGMGTDAGKSLVPPELLRDKLIVCDVVYSPLKTKLLRDAAAAGARTISGVDMLAWQGVLCCEKWTGQPVPMELMRQEAVKMLERYED